MSDRRIARWRWPLTRQISAIFTLLMITNAIVISVTIDIWGSHLLASQVSALSPASQRAFQSLNDGGLPPTQDIVRLQQEMAPLQVQIEAEANAALYIMIAVAGVVTMAAGYLLVGRLGRGLGNVALAARTIAQGDLAARATTVGLASREEATLISDFNQMAEALQHAQRELAESTASIAHELRTPLTILRGRLHGIADGVFALEPPEIKGLLFQVEGLARLVDDLQTLTLAQSDQLVLVQTGIDISAEVRNILVAMEPDLRAAGLKPVLELVPAPLIADAVRIRQVIAAVLSNACRYAANSGDIHIITTADEEHVTLAIIDRGPGLPDGANERAFDRFWRSEDSRNRLHGGSGLGLSIVRAIVEAHGGTVGLGNQHDGGARFSMMLHRQG